MPHHADDPSNDSHPNCPCDDDGGTDRTAIKPTNNRTRDLATNSSTDNPAIDPAGGRTQPCDDDGGDSNCGAV